MAHPSCTTRPPCFVLLRTFAVHPQSKARCRNNSFLQGCTHPRLGGKLLGVRQRFIAVLHGRFVDENTYQVEFEYQVPGRICFAARHPLICYLQLFPSEAPQDFED